MEQLIRQRGSVKARLTIFEKHVNNLESNFSSFKINDENTFLELEQRLERFYNLLNKFESLQSQIEVLSDDFESQLANREAFEKAYYGALARAKRFITYSAAAFAQQGDYSSRSSTRGSGDSIIDIDTNNQMNSENYSGVKLPVIEIATYNGDYDKWLEFRDTYESLIHKNSKISNIQKYHYLRSYLGPSVLEIIASLDFSENNYENAWQLICDRFNNSKILIQNHVKALFNIDKMSTESSTALRKIVDGVAKHLRALKTLNEPTESWDTLVIYLISTKLDEISLRKWEQLKASYKIPTLENLSTFLKERANLLESLEQSKVNNNQQASKRDKRIKSFYSGNQATKRKCSFCEKEHYIQECSTFLKLSLTDRLEQAKQKRLCLNCLRPGHTYKICYSKTCKTCNGKHNTLLHKGDENKSDDKTKDNNKNSQTESVNLSARNVVGDYQVLLSTVLVNVFDTNNKHRTARALLDIGSQSSFITQNLCEKLRLPKTPLNIKVSGLNETQSECKGKCHVRVQSKINAFSAEISCLVVPQITGRLPNFKVDKHNLDIPDNVRLADPHFDLPGEIDILIGADCFWDVICIGQIKLDKQGPYLQKTKFGWVMSGRVETTSNNLVQCNLSTHTEVDQQLCRFWALEEFPPLKLLSAEEKACEKHFLDTYSRDADGRFVVTIPLLDSLDKLGDSYETAKHRLLALERKFKRNENFKSKYVKFMNEYRSLGHMRKVKTDAKTKPTYYMPHHGVVKEGSITTKLRVVFDASCPTTSGYSFNDLQMTGPSIQSDIFSILLRYRKHNFVVASDVEKMYRMCHVKSEQTGLQRILWRDDNNDPMDIYELQTVTYGTRSAAFLAIRCLYQLGVECERECQEASRAIKEDFYVDDLLTGSDTVQATISLANDVSKTLSKAGFRLRKWISNSREVLRGIQTTDQTDVIDLGANESTKTLGLIWNGRKDNLLYKIGTNFNTRITKRTVLSEIAQIFDPLGLLSPIIIIAKIILRDIWLEGIGWDDSLTYSLHTRWIQFRDDLTSLNDLAIGRQVTCKDAISIEIHGFSDASMNAYGACVYVRTKNKLGEVVIKLLCAKSKIAPVKTQTVPRLELMAAVLLARLIDKVKTSLNLPIERTIYWCDSTIVLGWLNTSSNLLQVFVANRVSVIQELSNSNDWRHVPTQDNPADCVSRGVMPTNLLAFELYWSGPRWLKQDEGHWPPTCLSEQNLPELKKVTVIQTQVVCFENSAIEFDKYSNFNKLVRTVAYCFRFKENCLQPKETRNFKPLSAIEIDSALICLVKISQYNSFKDEILAFTNKGIIEKNSKLVKLNPFLDEGNILRVGGRLQNSGFSFNKKHPIVLSSKHRFTQLLFECEHKRLLHAGPQLLLATVRERFWPLGGRNLARKIYRSCVRCFRSNPKPINPIMGNLPSERLNPAPPFFITGVDYAGPFMIRDRQGRGFKVSKAYICLFVCFTTRAVHLELASDLTTEAFLAALRRFTARRGRPSRMYSDNGSNFIGANQELEQLGLFLQNNSKDLTESIENDGISWSFIPPRSPHFGGLWEAGVKATKFHLKRIAGNASLTFEKFYTLLTQIESVLNSRPMCPLSCEPSDYTPLTPSHFLIGRPMTSVVETELTSIPDNRLSHFQQIQKLKQHFWARWSLEYVSELQERVKWHNNYGSLKLNDLVIIKEDNSSPGKWLLGRIEELHPGKDGIARVATIRTQGGTIKRSFKKICPLPVNPGSNEGLKTSLQGGGDVRI